MTAALKQKVLRCLFFLFAVKYLCVRVFAFEYFSHNTLNTGLLTLEQYVLLWLQNLLLYQLILL